MSVGKEIRTQIKSIESTKKITSAMEMVAASKMRRAQTRAEAAKPYAQKIHQVIEHLAKSHSEYQHPYMTEKPIKRVGLILCSTDRGLCGGLNMNLFRKALQKLKAWKDDGIEVDIAVFGSKGEGFFKKYGGGDVVASQVHMGESPELKDVLGPLQVLLNAYDNGDIQALYLMHNDFVNTMTQQPTLSTLLPLTLVEDVEEPAEKPKSRAAHWDYIYEPSNESLLNLLLQRYIESQVYHAVVDNIACEQAARMMAMKSATDNAGDIIYSLKLSYNKARQAAITQEISEIVSGASAV